MADGDGNVQAVEEAVAYPLIVTEGVTRDGGGLDGAPSAPSAPLGRIVDRALKDALGWRVKHGDAKGFVAALKHSFDVTTVDGHTDWKWTPRTYAVQTDMGALTGAQASLYSRANVSLDAALPLLDGLYPLGSDFDVEDAEATRSIVRSELASVVAELGAEGGPRVQRVDQLFQQLLGVGQHPVDAAEVRGDLGVLRDRFDLRSERINTIAEEENFTNFLILVDYVNTLEKSWRAHRTFFDRRGKDVFLGTQLVLISRQLAAVAEQVQETTWAMDSVMLGPAERETTALYLEGQRKPYLTVAELLRWVDNFSTEEGPRLIQDSGKEGVRSFHATADLLAKLVTAAHGISTGPVGSITRAFQTVRVQRALAELARFLKTTAQLAGQIVRFKVKVTSVDPPSADSGVTVRVVVDGQNFQAGAMVVLQHWDDEELTKIEGDDVTWVSATQVDATFDLSDAVVGDWDVVVTNPDGSAAKGGFDVTWHGQHYTTFVPSVDSIQPSSGAPGRDLEITIRGQGFVPGTEVEIGRLSIQTTFVSDTEIKAKVTIPSGTKKGSRKLKVMNPGVGEDAIEPFAIK
jgi:IPT/TIG domain